AIGVQQEIRRVGARDLFAEVVRKQLPAPVVVEGADQSQVAALKRTGQIRKQPFDAPPSRFLQQRGHSVPPGGSSQRRQQAAPVRCETRSTPRSLIPSI